MPESQLSGLNNDELVELGALLETELAGLQAEIAKLSIRRAEAGTKLVKPAVKFGINICISGAGLCFAPVSLGLSLIVIAAGGAMILWDGVDVGRESAGLFQLRRELRRLDRASLTVRAQILAIDQLLTQRLGPP